MATVTSYGAAQMVTGSCHLLEIDTVRILIDCGMFQGGAEHKNYEPFGFDPKTIDYLILTHAHADHIGRVPKLVKEGFDGKILATKATFEIANIMLLDSAKILQEDFRTRFKKAQRRGEETKIQEPLYDEKDVEETFTKQRISIKYNVNKTLQNNISVTFKEAGHILGSAFIEIEYREFDIKRKIVFSGDLGSRDRLVIDGLDHEVDANALFIESTYGDRNHREMDESIKEFKQAIIDTINRDGNVLIPSFALERTQEVLYLLREMYELGELPRCKVFLDSPLAIKATNLYARYPKNLSPICEAIIEKGNNPFKFPSLEFSQRVKQSIKINYEKQRAIIIAGSGMCTGGRILHHLKHRLWNPANAVLFVGYQVGGTLGRKIVDGAPYIHIYGEKIAVKAKVHTINGFSAHGDQNDLIDWIKHFEKLDNIFLIHGEADKCQHFKEAIQKALDIKVHIMKEKETMYL